MQPERTIVPGRLHVNTNQSIMGNCLLNTAKRNLNAVAVSHLKLGGLPKRKRLEFRG